MHQRKKILAALFLLTILLIVLVKQVLQRELEETQHTRLNFFSNYVDNKKSSMIQAIESNARLIGSAISNDQQLADIFNNIEQATPINLNRYNQQFVDRTQHFINNSSSSLKLLRFTGINSQITTSDSNCTHCINSTNTFPTPTDDSIHGLSIENNELLYTFVFPHFMKGKIIGFLEIGFDINFLIKQYHLTNDINTPSIVLIYYNIEQNVSNYIKDFNNTRFDKSLIFHNTESINENMVNNIVFVSHNNSTDNTLLLHSFYPEPKKIADVLTICNLQMLYTQGHAFIVSKNYDFMFEKAKELNNAILIINIFIIVTVMAGFTLTAFNRVKIIKEKKDIQKSEARLQAINQSKDKFFSIVAHDLKNPFNGIMGLSGYLMTDYDNVVDDERKEIIYDINIASKNAFNLLQNLLEWTRAQSGTIKNNPVIVDPRQIVGLSLETVANLAKNKEITIIENYFTDVKGYADENLVATVIRNLATNAVKFSPRGKPIEIIANTYEGELFFQVKDYGMGISPDEIDQLFRIDVNFHKRGTEKETGTGLGLKICKEFVEYCGGRIWCVSEPGKGSSFYFTIPKYKG